MCRSNAESEQANKQQRAILTQDEVFRGREKLRSVRQLVDDSDFIIVPTTNDPPEDIIDAMFAKASPAEMPKSIRKTFSEVLSHFELFVDQDEPRFSFLKNERN